MELIKKNWKIIAGALIGGAAGYAYYYFIGCNSGSCPITSNWHISTAYGVLLGVIAAFPAKKNKEIRHDEGKNN
ncbi:MAG: DUF6132 family protein [Bacteroidota bacterium]